MQYKNQVVILGTISFFFKTEHTVQSNRSANQVRKETAILLCCCRLDFKLYSSLLQCSGHVQSKNGVDLVEVYFYKSEKTSGQTVRPKIKTVALFYFIMATCSLQTSFVAFTMLWTYPNQK